MEQYALEHDGWYPRGDGKALDIQVKELEAWLPVLQALTSHAQSRKLSDEWKRTGVINPDLCCHHYNMGINAKNAPRGAIVMYYYKPTKWECWMHKEDFIGRPVFSDGLWDFIPEAEFQRRQDMTLEYLETRAKEGPVSGAGSVGGYAATPPAQP